MDNLKSNWYYELQMNQYTNENRFHSQFPVDNSQWIGGLL